MSSMSWGMGSLMDEIQGQVEACPDQKIALVGYSQGSLVIQVALAYMSAHGYDDERAAIAAVLLLANPLQDPAVDGYAVLGSMADGTAANQVGKIQELVSRGAIRSVAKWLFDNDDMSDMVDAMAAPYPTQFRDITLSYCNVGDALCAPQSSLTDAQMGTIHGGYTPDELAAFGRAAAELLVTP
jgi:hypothetical protein